MMVSCLAYFDKRNNEKTKDYINFEVSVNDVLIARDDISFWSIENQLYIFNLSENDKVSLRITSKKDNR